VVGRTAALTAGSFLTLALVGPNRRDRGCVTDPALRDVKRHSGETRFCSCWRSGRGVWSDAASVQRAIPSSLCDVAAVQFQRTGAAALSSLLLCRFSPVRSARMLQTSWVASHLLSLVLPQHWWGHGDPERDVPLGGSLSFKRFGNAPSLRLPNPYLRCGCCLAWWLSLTVPVLSPVISAGSGSD